MQPGRPLALLAGALLVAEAAVSPFVGGERAYHLLNVPLNVVLAASLVALLRALRPRRLAVVGGWIGVATAAIAAAGGILPAATGAAPGWLEGITHTAVLASFLGLALFAAGLLLPPRAARPAAAWTLLAGSALPVALVLAGVDDPKIFLLPEAVAGIGIAWLGWEALR